MISKESILHALEQAKTEANVEKIQEIINIINKMDNERLQATLKEKGIKSKWSLKREVKKITKVRKHSKFTPLNDFISYGVKGKTMHIHVIPKDLHHMLNKEGLKKGELQLINALDKIQVLLKTDKKYKKINKIYAVSNLITKPISRIFEDLDFDVKSMRTELARQDPELKKFYKRFKARKNLGRAELSTQKLMSDDWNKLKENKKNILTPLNKDKFAQTMQYQVKSEQEVAEYNTIQNDHKENKNKTLLNQIK